MNLDSLSFTLSQISYLVDNLTKKNYKASVQELSYLVALQGAEANRHLLRCLLSYVEVGLAENKSSLQVQLLQQECISLLSKPNVVTNFCYAFDHPLQQQKSLRPAQQILSSLSRSLKLSPAQDLLLGLALLHSSVPETRTSAQNFVRNKQPDFLKSISDQQSLENLVQELGIGLVHTLFNHILTSANEHIGAEAKENLQNIIQKELKKGVLPIVLTPLLKVDQIISPIMSKDSSNMPNQMMDGSLADLVIELGYGCCANVTECRRALSSFGNREITALAIAKVLSAMMRTYTGLDQTSKYWGDKDKNDAPHTWNIDVFVQTIKELNPSLRWEDVIKELDHPEFKVPDRQALSLLFTALKLGLKSQGFHPDNFPTEGLYRPWKNVEGQYSLIIQILKNGEIFSFADHMHRTVSVDVLKVPPDGENKDANTWRSLELMEILLYLSEHGLFTQIMDLLKHYITLAPDIVALSLMQASAPNNQKNSPSYVLRQDLLTAVLPVFLGNHPNSALILHTAWHAQNSLFQPIVMNVMSDWYLRGDSDQSRLTRILDVAQDLKGLTLLLNDQSYPFIIDLACLASRREFLKLEKWLTDKIQQHGEPFISACVKFLQRRCPQILSGMMKDDIPKVAQLPHETIATIVNCLGACERNVSPELSEAIRTTVNNCKLILGNPRQPPPGAMRPHHVLDPAFNSSTVGAGPQLFQNAPVDTLAGISSSLAGINLASSGGTPTTPGIGGPSAFNITGGLGQLVATPGSPSRMMGTPSSTQSPFNPLLPMAQQLHTGGGGGGGPVGSQTSTGSTQPFASGLTLSNLARLNSQSQGDKLRPDFPVGDTSGLYPENQPPREMLSKEVEDEANSYFQRIYNHPPHPTLSVDEVLDMLKKFQNSTNQREKDVFSCMLRNLFEEYRFFPQYPEKELNITAQLFGGIIERGLLSSNYIHLGIALRFVLDALRKPMNTKMFFFGITALDKCKSRLKEYRKYCEHLSQLPHFQEFPRHLIEYIESGMKSEEPSNVSSSPAPATSLPKSSAAPAKPSAIGMVTRPSIANATNIDTLLVATEKDEKITAPPDNIQDKIAFIFNNLSQLNLQTKCDELRDLLSEEYWPWVAQYLVMKRASIEFNFHSLYANFLDVLKIPELTKMVTRETYRNIRVLLTSDKGIANFSDRSLLKNLGHWLGMLTLAKNKPILQIDMDMKTLLAEAYHKGQQELLYVVPFIAKVLEACAKSRVFKPPNPWTMALMNVLAELHQEPDLKLNLKFEIEVLCKNLNIDVYELKPTIYLKDQEKLKPLDFQLSSQTLQKSESTTTSTVISSSAITQPTPTLAATEETSGTITPAAVVTTSTVATPASASTPTPNISNGPPEPRFNYMDINIGNMSNSLSQHIVIPNMQIFQANPQLKNFIRPSLERAIQEWIHPVVDRSIKIALTTCEQIVKKDFALDPDDARMRAAAHHMVCNLTAGMAMITCRDNLIVSISNNIKTSFQQALIGNNAAQYKDAIEPAANLVAQENMELACAFIQKTAVEKAIPEIDKRLHAEYEVRKAANYRYCDSVALNYHLQMPEPIRLKVGPVTPQQMAVYEEFARNIPGFQPLSERDAAAFMPKPEILPGTPFQTNAPAQLPFTAAPPVAEMPIDENLGGVFDKVRLELDQLIQAGGLSTAQASHLHTLFEAIIMVRSSRDPTLAAALIQRTLEGLQDSIINVPSSSEAERLIRYRELHICILKALQDQHAFGVQWTNKQVTRCLLESRDEIKSNPEVADVLIRSHLLNYSMMDPHLVQAMENGTNYAAVNFAMQFVQLYLVENRHYTHTAESELYNTIEMLARINAHSRQTPDGLSYNLGNLIDMLRANHDPNLLTDRAAIGPTAHIHSGIMQAREFDDPPGLLDKTEFLLREWVNMYHSSTAAKDPTKTFSMFVQQMNVHGILKTDDLITRFFRLSTQMCVDLCYRALNDKTSGSPTMIRTKCFHTLDAFVRLIALLVKHSGDANNTGTKINLLNKVVGIVAGVLLQDHDVHSTKFQQLPYHRIFVILFLELNTPEPVLEIINYQVLTAFCHIYHILRPVKAPGFAYAWLELVSHRVFIGRMLAITPQQRGWGMYAQLLIDLFKFLAPFLRNAELNKPVALFYKGTLRVLLVLLHDFPEFLCDYHYSFCDVIPPNCIQMRNLILSAFPRNMRLPDPFTPNLKVDMLPEIVHAPRVMTSLPSLIQPANFKKDLDSYLKARAPVTFLSELRSNLQISHEPGMRYNIPLMNALVLYVGTQAISHIRAKNLVPNMSTIAHSAHMDIFQNLAVDLDTEGRYLFLNAIANQLRYPNSHTHYFSCTLLYLFAEANTEAIQEQITRVLLERLIVNRPHPWGLLITFIELIKNPTYKFWSHEFVHCAHEIEKLFESVARSCMVQKVPGGENEMIE